MRVVTWSSRNRSWLTSTMAPRKLIICCSSHWIALRSRWLVGSSRISTSWCWAKSRASATRLICPPESWEVSMSAAPSMPSRSSAASTCQPVPMLWRTVPTGSVGICSKKPTLMSRPRRISPESGSSLPAMILSSVDFPTPLMPTTPIRSPEEIVRERSCKRTRSVPWRETFCRSTRIAMRQTG